MADPSTAGGASAIQSEYQSDQYEPAQAKPAVSAVLSPSASAFTDPSIDPTKPFTSTPNNATELSLNDHPSSAAPYATLGQHSQSRSMSRASSSAGSSSPEIFTGTEKPSNLTNSTGAAQSFSNGPSVSSPLSSQVQVSAEYSNTPVPDSIVQEHAPSDVVSNQLLDPSVENLDGITPHDSPVPSTNQAKSPPQQANKSMMSLPKARLPHDKLGMLEDRIKEDPRGDIEAWLALIDEHKKKGKIDEARSTYDKFLAIFPTAVSQY